MQSVTIGNNQAGQRFDKFLRKYLPEAGTSFLYKMLRKKNITLNGKKAEGKEILAVGDRVCFFFADETFEKFSGLSVSQLPQTSVANEGANVLDKSVPGATVSKAYQNAYRKLAGIEVLYEDDNVLILNKPVGILTQKAEPTDLSLNEWLIGYLLHTGALTEEVLHSFKPSVCNRLDRNTSGIVLCGKSLKGSQVLSRVIKERTIRKFYHTICVGKLTKEEMLEGYLIKNGATNKVSVSKSPVKSGQKKADSSYIKTAYKPLLSTVDYTLLEVELITGKTHQIRAHLASIGHPIIGDFKYGNRKINQQLSLESQLLHAYRIEFPKEEDTLPENLRGKVITAPYPARFEQLVQKLKNE